MDEFKDRIILSTVEGEKTIMKSDIRSAVYDSEVKAIMLKGKNQLKEGQYIKAYLTFEKAVKLDPDNEEARERRQYLRSHLEVKTKKDLIDSIEAKNRRLDNAHGKVPRQRVYDELGLTLVPGEKYVSIEKIANTGPGADGRGIAPGDSIVAVWGEMTAYMDPDEVAAMLLFSGEARFTLERECAPELSSTKTLLGRLLSRYERTIGAHLELRKGGITVKNVFAGGPFEKAGIKKGDLVRRIAGKNTRYMPFSEVVRIVRENQNKKVEIVIRRDITLWRKERST